MKYAHYVRESINIEHERDDTGARREDIDVASERARAVYACTEFQGTLNESGRMGS